MLFRHWPALCGALLAALIVASPLIAFPIAAGPAYRGINIAHISDEYFYLTRGKEALEGRPLGQPFLAEGKEMKDPTFNRSEQVLVLPLRLLGLADRVNVVTYYNVVNTLAVFCIVLLMYAFAFALSRDRWIALGGALLAVLGYSITEAHTLFYDGYNIYGRSVFPFMSSIPLFGFLCVLHELLVRRRGMWLAIVAGALLGYLCYIYFYAWTYLFALLAALAALYLAQRDFDGLRRVCAAGVLGALIGSYNLIELFSYLRGPLAQQLSYFYFSVRSHAPVMSNAGIATALLFSIVLYRKGKAQNSVYIAGVIAAGWIALNQQLITGRVLQYGHYFWYFVSPLSIILAVYLLSRLLPPRLGRWFAFGLIALALVNGAGQQYRAFNADLPSKLEEQRYAPILAALEREPPGVVLTGAASESGPFLVTIYTDDDLYWIPAAENYVVPIDRLKEALLLHLYLNRDARADPMLYLNKALSAHTDNEYTYLYTELEGLYSGFDYRGYERRLAADDPALVPVRRELIAELGERYAAAFNSPENPRSLLERRNVRYVVWDSARYPQWDLSPLAPKELVRSGPLALYQLDY